MIRCTVAQADMDGTLHLDFGPGQPRGKLEIDGPWVAAIFVSSDLLIVMEENGIAVYCGEHKIPRKFLSLPTQILDDLHVKRVIARA